MKRSTDKKIASLLSLSFLFPPAVLLFLFARSPLMPDNSFPGLSNFAKVSEELYRGAQPTRQGFLELQKMGIRTIINLRATHTDLKLLKGLKLQSVHIKTTTFHIKENDIAAFLKTVTNKSNQPVFIHCQHGSDRTGVMTAVYRMYVQGWTLDEAMAELPNFGFHKIWQNLKTELKGLDMEELHKKVELAESPPVHIIK